MKAAIFLMLMFMLFGFLFAGLVSFGDDPAPVGTSSGNDAFKPAQVEGPQEWNTSTFDDGFKIRVSPGDGGGGKILIVEEDPILPIAHFTSNTTGGLAPLSVQFWDNSSNTTGISWDFDGDNVEDSNTSSPFWVFGVGNHSVNLTASNGNGTDVYAAYINVTEAEEPEKENPILPVAYFKSNVSSGFAPLAVQFWDNSSNASSISWDFDGDHVEDSNTSSPFWVFGVGNHSVNLTASNGNGTDVYAAYINVTEVEGPEEEDPILPMAHFTSNVTGGLAPLSVQFWDNSSNATIISWDFDGDNVEDSNSSSPVWTFNAFGPHEVNLIASNANGSHSYIGTIYVTPDEEIPEFPTIAIPIMIVGMLFFISRRNLK
ncbi:PKD repeat protein [Methanohalophilus levihalophilus]|uniref:PEF-CTERM sorting domain-containing protein n=1 Tax=Methanohalophilus levihalophilus TaxID=1431282 RepID=UPI001AEB630A|nr:PKD domain-containing protein [Methanohalophilus levihalophilus]MBP2031004.1 PKD repeat protein [Methanohalophilus levihalophilus]